MPRLPRLPRLFVWDRLQQLPKWIQYPGAIVGTVLFFRLFQQIDEERQAKRIEEEVVARQEANARRPPLTRERWDYLQSLPRHLVNEPLFPDPVTLQTVAMFLRRAMHETERAVLGRPLDRSELASPPPASRSE
ncbi:hypothetical protein CAOG_07349 [Capsaspora owczarzaki ATCC 30864]|uniref:hypothetical protein n=1 Tax=Capsaspora owczarzaki (strain ATCC 30864) TaxID=595528 RepID=UPI0001FE4673|nr:hypothetical protein CAOG_07349 [Capsaspora owczarzaki ATCC 30864]|eukprot:XP_004343208.1 hypothetical protein CAOG_07349 [Capsaspora owczarzaki ATCC 30864]